MLKFESLCVYLYVWQWHQCSQVACYFRWELSVTLRMSLVWRDLLACSVSSLPHTALQTVVTKGRHTFVTLCFLSILYLALETKRRTSFQDKLCTMILCTVSPSCLQHFLHCPFPSPAICRTSMPNYDTLLREFLDTVSWNFHTYCSVLCVL